MENQSHEEQTGGYFLFVPPTPLIKPRFVLVDDRNGVFLQIVYLDTNPVPWNELALHSHRSPALMFSAVNDKLHEANKRNDTNAALVAIERTTSEGVFEARLLGTVRIAQYPSQAMNWHGLESTKGRHIVDEIRNGFLRSSYDNRPNADRTPFVFATPPDVLNKMPRPWHLHADVLNEELDNLLAGAERIGPAQRWIMYP